MGRFLLVGVCPEGLIAAQPSVSTRTYAAMAADSAHSSERVRRAVTAAVISPDCCASERAQDSVAFAARQRRDDDRGGADVGQRRPCCCRQPLDVDQRDEGDA